MSTETQISTMSQKAMPVSVIQRIFLAFNTRCHKHPHLNCRLRSCLTSSPLLLGKICKEWREIAWNMPDIWCWIEITESRKNPDTRLQLAKEWLERTSGQPLTIIVHPVPSMALYTAPLPTTLFKLIAEYSMQWKVLDVVCYGECTTTLNAAARGRTPILESAHIAFQGASSDNLPPNFLEDAPNLLRLNLIGTKSIGENMRPWLRLTSLILTGSSTNADLLLLLDNVPNLETLRFDQTGRGHTIISPEAEVEWRPEHSSPLKLPRRLKSLILKGYHPSFFLANMEAPESLARISIIDPGVETPTRSTFSSITDFIDRSKCLDLRALGISTMLPIDMESISLLLSKLNSLRHLYINSKNTRNYKQTMNQIPQLLNPSLRAASSDNGILLPNLQILYYSIIDIGIVPQKLVDMIKCRCKGQDIEKGDFIKEGEFAKLRVVRFNKTNPKVLLSPLQAEIEEGLKITYDLPYKGEPFE